MEILIEVICESIDLFAGIIFDVLESKVGSAKCIKKVREKKKRTNDL